jgi:hypothetical protein
MIKKGHQRHNTDLAMFSSKKQSINIVGTIKR